MQPTSPTSPASSWPSSAHACTAAIPPLPGKRWPEQGGFYVGVMRSADGLAGWHLVRPEGAEFTFRSCWRYSPWSKPVKKAYCRYDGYANTLTMAAARNSLAKKIRNLPGDCYLPSRAESALLYAVIPEQFRENWHWTSTQHSCEEAWGQNFTQGYQSSTHLTQDAEGWCLVVRRVPIENSAA